MYHRFNQFVGALRNSSQFEALIPNVSLFYWKLIIILWKKINKNLKFKYLIDFQGLKIVDKKQNDSKPECRRNDLYANY
jgi:hypothetical protein